MYCFLIYGAILRTDHYKSTLSLINEHSARKGSTKIVKGMRHGCRKVYVSLSMRKGFTLEELQPIVKGYE